MSSFHSHPSVLTRFFVPVAAFALVATAILSSSKATGSPERVDQLVRTALQLEANVARGAAVYGQNCVSCHSHGAIGDSRNVIPALAGQRQAYLIKQFADFVELERHGETMRAVVAKAALNHPQVWADLAGYLSELTPLRLPESGDGTGVELGEAIFQEQCASCHEEDARGDDDGFVPSLRNQHYSYLVRQIRGMGTSHRNVDDDLSRFLNSLETDEITAVADYLSQMRGPVRDRSTLTDDGSLRN